MYPSVANAVVDFGKLIFVNEAESAFTLPFTSAPKLSTVNLLVLP